MSQSMPEVLEYRNLVGKLARIDNAVDFSGPSSTAKIQTGVEAIHSLMAVTPRELEAITQKNGENGHDKTLMGRLITVGRQIYKLTLLVTVFMTLTIALLAVLTFLGFKGNFVNWSTSRQPQKIAAASNPSTPEAMVPANDSPIVKRNDNDLAR